MPYSHAFTVFTPTYNRAHTLHRVYDSLESQTERDFEWLIVDDGSTDGTERVVERWQTLADFPIRYVCQANKGKHIAFNRAVRDARGELFLPFDSDDACTANALERFLYHWQTIPAADRSTFSGVTVLCADQEARLIGTRFPRDVTDSDSLEMVYRFKIRGEKWGFHRTEVLRQYPFPEHITGQYVPESIVWFQIARTYRTRFVNETLRVYFIDQPSMVHGRPPGKDAAGRLLGHRQVLNDQQDYFRAAPLEFCRAAGQYVRLSMHAGRSVADQFTDLTNVPARLLWACALPAGTALYLRDKYRK